MVKSRVYKIREIPLGFFIRYSRNTSLAVSGVKKRKRDKKGNFNWSQNPTICTLVKNAVIKHGPQWETIFDTYPLLKNNPQLSATKVKSWFGNQCRGMFVELYSLFSEGKMDDVLSFLHPDQTNFNSDPKPTYEDERQIEVPSFGPNTPLVFPPPTNEGGKILIPGFLEQPYQMETPKYVTSIDLIFLASF